MLPTVVVRSTNRRDANASLWMVLLVIKVAVETFHFTSDVNCVCKMDVITNTSVR